MAASEFDILLVVSFISDGLNRLPYRICDLYCPESIASNAATRNGNRKKTG